MKKKVLIVSAVIVLLIGFWLYRRFSNARQNKKIASTDVKRGNLAEELTISGQIKAEEDVTLHFQTSGKLAWLGVAEGDPVKKYQVIANLDAREVKKKLDKYLNTFLKTRTDFDQTKDDNDDKALTDAIKRTLDKSQLDLNNAVLDVEVQHLAVEFSRLVSPIEGLVIKTSPSYAGVNVTATGAEYEIVNPATIYFEALADQTEVAKLREDMSGQLTLDAYPEKMLAGVIKNISFTPKTEESGTVYTVKFIFPSDNTDYKYKIGMTGDLTLITQIKNNVLYLPIKFVKTDNGKKYVNLAPQKNKTYINTGLETDDLIEIKSGLSEKDIVYD